jgi:hypothetical protein
MLRKALFTIAAVILVFGLSGCKKRTGETKEPTKTMADYQAEAEKEINRENMAEELEKLEKEVEEDILRGEEL